MCMKGETRLKRFKSPENCEKSFMFRKNKIFCARIALVLPSGSASSGPERWVHSCDSASQLQPNVWANYWSKRKRVSCLFLYGSRKYCSSCSIKKKSFFLKEKTFLLIRNICEHTRTEPRARHFLINYFATQPRIGKRDDFDSAGYFFQSSTVFVSRGDPDLM